MKSQQRTRWLNASYVGLSALVAGASVRSSLRFAAISDGTLGAWWWLPSEELFEDPSIRGWTIFLISACTIGLSVKTRSHRDIALSTVGATIAVYLFLLDRWSMRPSPVIDPRIIYTMMFSLVPLYVAILALVAHAAVAAMDAKDAR